MNYQNGYPYYARQYGVQGGERQFFFPFLTGALVGGAAVEECFFVKKYK